MGKITKEIRRGEAGTRDTLEEIRRLILDAMSDNRSKLFESLAHNIPIQALDRALRELWNYVEDGDVELIRTAGRLADDFWRTGRFEGDCDDACVVAGVILILQQRPIEIVAVRFPADAQFSHVFIRSHRFRIDPTAPPDANYDGCEEMVVRITTVVSTWLSQFP